MSEVVAVVGLGYVGLPLAVEFGKRFDTIGFDFPPPKSTVTAGFATPLERFRAKIYGLPLD